MFLAVENLSIDLGEFKLKNVSLRVNRGEYMVLIGPTGSGKSILLESIAGFYTPDSGRIMLNGRDITHIPPEQRNVSVVYQDYMLFPHMTVKQNIAYGLRKREKKEEKIAKDVERVSRILKISHLLHRHPDTLSGGEMQRVAIARALVVEPQLLLMDEPFAALDVKTRENLRSLVKNAMQEYQTTVIHVTHDFEDVFSLASHVAVLHNGKIIQVGTPEDVFSNPITDFVADFVGTNILQCKGASITNDGSLIQCGKVKIHTTDRVKKGEKISVAIRPESIIISPEPVHTSARNVLEGIVSEVTNRGHITWVHVKTGNILLKVVITPNSAEYLGIEEGKQVYLIFKASGVRVVR